MTATELQAKKGWQGLVLKALRAEDFVLTVHDTEDISPHFRRVRLRGGGILHHIRPHPTMWIRLWFADGTRAHQRGYTILNPDADNDTLDIDFAIHSGRAADWALAAQPGDQIAATVMGSSFTLPEQPPRRYVIVGDTASLPAITTLLDAIGEVPAQVWLEYVHDDDTSLPLAAQPAHHVTWVRRARDGQDLVDRVTRDLDGERLDDCFCWVACDTKTTRKLSQLLRTEHGVAKDAMKVQAYWAPPKH